MKLMTDGIQNDHLKRRDLLLIVFLFALWWLRLPLLLILRDSLSENVYQLCVQITKILGWIVPVVAYIALIEHRPVLDALKLRRHLRQGVLYGLALPAVYLLVLAIVQCFGVNLIHYHPDVPFWTWVSAVGLAGITEEIVFRGFILTKLRLAFPFWLANTLTAFLFLLMHLPFWLLINFTPGVLDLVTLIALGLLLGWVVKRSDSLWAAIIAHTLYDLIVVVLLR
jgi:hypothetical protein